MPCIMGGSYRIFTLTGNLLAETAAAYARWEAGQTVRATSEQFQVGGKGINVARMALRLGSASMATGFAGGHQGQRCRAWLGEAGVPCHLVETGRETRQGWVVRSPDQPETTFLGRDVALEVADWQAMVDWLGDHLRPGDVLAICGSIPGWQDSFAAMLEPVLRPISWVLDTYGPPLKRLAALGPTLVKINRQELLGLTGAASGGADTSTLLKHVAEGTPGSHWVVTDGGGAIHALWADEPGAVRSLAAPRVEMVSPTGCGDVLLAGMLSARMEHGLPWPESLDAALPLAAANAADARVAAFPMAAAAQMAHQHGKPWPWQEA